MAEASVEQVVQEVVRALAKAQQTREPGLVIVRCSGSREVDHCRETLLRTTAAFKWKSLPVAELDPPDLIGHAVEHASPQGPCFVAYGLPKGRDGRVLNRFLELLTIAGRQYADRPFLLCLVLGLEEIRDVSKGAPHFWKSRTRYVGWPVEDADASFVPALIRGGVSMRGGAVSTDGTAMANVGGHIAASPEMANIFGNVALDPNDMTAQGFGLTPWAGAPFKDGDEIPQYIREAAPPAGRRWGRSLAPDDAEGSELIDRCRTLLDQRHTEYARQGLAKAAKRFRSANNSVAMAECFVLLGRASELRFDHSVALEWYEQAIHVYESVDDRPGVSDCCNMIGYLRYLHGDLDGAFSFFDRALRRDEESGDKLRSASGYRRIGIIMEQRKEWNQAHSLYERAAEIERENGDRFALSRSLHHQARVLAIKERYKDAIGMLEHSLKIKEELEDQSGLAAGYHEMGNLELRQRNLQEALDAYEQALEIEERLGDVPGVAVTHAQIGLCRRELFQFADAVKSFAVAKELFYRLQSPYVTPLEKALESTKDMVEPRVFREMLAEAKGYIDGLTVEGGQAAAAAAE